MNGFKWNRTSSYTWVGRAALKRQGINGSQYSRNHGDLLKLRDSRGGGAEAKNPSRKQMTRRKNLLDSRKSKGKGPKLESDWWSKGKQSSKHGSIADGEEKMGGWWQGPDHSVLKGCTVTPSKESRDSRRVLSSRATRPHLCFRGPLGATQNTQKRVEPKVKRSFQLPSCGAGVSAMELRRWSIPNFFYRQSQPTFRINWIWSIQRKQNLVPDLRYVFPNNLDYGVAIKHNKISYIY